MTLVRSLVLFMVVLAAYVALAVRTAGVIPLTYDEVYTFKLAQFRSVPELWGWLRAGTDLNPPANYLLTRLAHEAVGPTAVGTRLPTIAAFAGAVLLVFLYLRRTHRSERAGWFAGLTLLACNLPAYALVARAYPLMLFWGAAVLLFRHLAREAATPGRRALAGAGLGLAVSASVYTHYYGAFVLVPIALSEAAGWWQTRRLSWAVLVPTAVGAASWYGVLPLIQTAREFSAGFWGRKPWAVEAVYAHMLLNFITPLIAAAAACYLAQPRRDPVPGAEEPEPVPAADAAAVVGFLAIPVVGVVAARLAIGAFHERYVILGYLGAACALAGPVADRLRTRPVVSVGLLLALGGWWLVGAESRYRLHAAEAGETRAEYAVPGRIAAAAPLVVVVEPVYYLCAVAAAPHERVVYAADPALSLQFRTQDTDDRNLLQLARVDPRLTVRPFAEVALPAGAVVVGDGWQKRVWEGAGYGFEPVATGHPRVHASRVVKVPPGR